MRHCSSSGNLNYMRQGSLEQKKHFSLLNSLPLTCSKDLIVFWDARMSAAFVVLPLLRVHGLGQEPPRSESCLQDHGASGKHTLP